MDNQDYLKTICHALSSNLRLDILRVTEFEKLSCTEMSKIFGYPLSTIISNVDILEKAGLLFSTYVPARNGHTRYCSSIYYDIFIKLGSDLLLEKENEYFLAEVPIGNYMNFDVAPTCGFVVDETHIFMEDSPSVMINPIRIHAQLLWFKKGFVEYYIPLEKSKEREIELISIEAEICAEAPGFNNNYKSDITLWLNGKEIGTYLAPGDFGGVKGRYSPEYWSLEHTQFGKLVTWKISQDSSYINDYKASAITIEDLQIPSKEYVTLRIGIKENATNVGGINIFGKNFGNYNQDIRFMMKFK